MPMVIRCEHCKAPLKLPDEYVGKEVRCPNCQKEFVARQDLEAPPPRPASPPREPERQDPDPDVRRDEERPSRRRRDDDEYRRDDDLPRRRRDYDDDDRPRRGRSYDERRYMEAHRGGLILTLGILSIVGSCLCAFVGLGLGIPAAVMASTDNAKMRNGTMDPSGQGATTGGQVCGIIGIVISVLGCGLGILNLAMNHN